jgi:hypothetical protein
VQFATTASNSVTAVGLAFSNSVTQTLSLTTTPVTATASRWNVLNGGLPAGRALRVEFRGYMPTTAAGDFDIRPDLYIGGKLVATGATVTCTAGASTRIVGRGELDLYTLSGTSCARGGIGCALGTGDTNAVTLSIPYAPLLYTGVLTRDVVVEVTFTASNSTAGNDITLDWFRYYVDR